MRAGEDDGAYAYAISSASASASDHVYESAKIDHGNASAYGR